MNMELLGRLGAALGISLILTLLLLVLYQDVPQEPEPAVQAQAPTITQVSTSGAATP
jgi:hypothetical protein